MKKYSNKINWIYAFKTNGSVKIDGHYYGVYKIGRSGRPNPHLRIQEFTGPSKCNKLLYCSLVKNSVHAEHFFLTRIKKAHNILFLKHLGKEYFACLDEADFVKAFASLLSKYTLQEAQLTQPRRSLRLSSMKKSC
jgi:hypothetical protein